jgi:hypothetical protein
LVMGREHPDVSLTAIGAFDPFADDFFYWCHG